ncbi:MAG TPA: GGDEF domain-containing protein [Gaiellaceae bacterium]|nr:GGDEF domain-containing protein [Gaiellaceae bacterium]
MSRRARELWPYLAGGAAAFAMIPVGTGDTGVDGSEVLLAAALFVAVALAAVFAPWSRLPRALGLLPLLACFAAIGLLRDAEGAAASGYGTLVLLPVFWLALHARRRDVVATLPFVGALFVAPILVDSSRYPEAEWRRALLWMIVTPIVGLTTQTLVERVSATARHDPLTGLANRLAWEERLPLALAVAGRTGRPLSLAVLDLDGFKAYNDTHGHPAGDRLLVVAAAGWAGEIRAVDLLARIGGDEFGLLLPDAPLAAAKSVVARAAAAAPEARFSAGVVEWDGGEDVAALVARADAALYADKTARAAAR